MSKWSKWALVAALVTLPTFGYALTRYHARAAARPHCHCEKK